MRRACWNLLSLSSLQCSPGTQPCSFWLLWAGGSALAMPCVLSLIHLLLITETLTTTFWPALEMEKKKKKIIGKYNFWEWTDSSASIRTEIQRQMENPLPIYSSCAAPSKLPRCPGKGEHERCSVLTCWSQHWQRQGRIYTGPFFNHYILFHEVHPGPMLWWLVPAAWALGSAPFSDTDFGWTWSYHYIHGQCSCLLDNWLYAGKKNTL